MSVRYVHGKCPERRGRMFVLGQTVYFQNASKSALLYYSADLQLAYMYVYDVGFQIESGLTLKSLADNAKMQTLRH